MKLHNTVYFQVNLTMLLDFATWPPLRCVMLKKGGQVTESKNIVRLT